MSKEAFELNQYFTKKLNKLKNIQATIDKETKDIITSTVPLFFDFNGKEIKLNPFNLLLLSCDLWDVKDSNYKSVTRKIFFDENLLEDPKNKDKIKEQDYPLSLRKLSLLKSFKTKYSLTNTITEASYYLANLDGLVVDEDIYLKNKKNGIEIKKISYYNVEGFNIVFDKNIANTTIKIKDIRNKEIYNLEMKIKEHAQIIVDDLIEEEEEDVFKILYEVYYNYLAYRNIDYNMFESKSNIQLIDTSIINKLILYSEVIELILKKNNILSNNDGKTKSKLYF